MTWWAWIIALSALGVALAALGRRASVALREQIVASLRTEASAAAALVTIDALFAVNDPPRRSAIERTIRDAIEDTPPDHGLVVTDISAGEIIYSSGYVEAVLGLPRDGFLGDAWRGLVFAPDLPRLAADTARHDHDGTYRYRASNGSLVPLYWSWSQDPGLGLAVCYVREARLEVAQEQARDARRLIDTWGPPRG